MAYSSLKRKTPLKAKKPLCSRNKLQSNRQFYSCKSLKDSYREKIISGSKPAPKKKNTVYKPKDKYESIFSSDLTVCYVTRARKDSGADIHVHHVFGAANKTNSEKYHFLIPLRADWHDMADYGIHKNIWKMVVKTNAKNSYI